MATTRLARSFGGALLLLLGCGGKVFVDTDGDGGSTTGVIGNVTCDLLCGGPTGVCGCEGMCSDGKTRAVGCGGGTGGIQCTCDVDGQAVGDCTESTLTCGLPGSCCATVFGM